MYNNSSQNVSQAAVMGFNNGGPGSYNSGGGMGRGGSGRGIPRRAGTFTKTRMVHA